MMVGRLASSFRNQQSNGKRGGTSSAIRESATAAGDLASPATARSRHSRSCACVCHSTGGRRSKEIAPTRRAVEGVEGLEARHTEALRAVSYEPFSRRFSVFAFYLNAGTMMAFPRTVSQPNSLPPPSSAINDILLGYAPACIARFFTPQLLGFATDSEMVCLFTAYFALLRLFLHKGPLAPINAAKITRFWRF